LLIVLALNLGDWPYIDEILADVQPSVSTSAVTSTDSGAPASDKSGAPAKLAVAYQLLLHLGQFALNGASIVIPTATTQSPFDLRSSVYHSVVPDRLDRPPIAPVGGEFAV
jgi:hypothetical protein